MGSNRGVVAVRIGRSCFIGLVSALSLAAATRVEASPPGWDENESDRMRTLLYENPPAGLPSWISIAPKLDPGAGAEDFSVETASEAFEKALAVISDPDSDPDGRHVGYALIAHILWSMYKHGLPGGCGDGTASEERDQLEALVEKARLLSLEVIQNESENMFGFGLIVATVILRLDGDAWLEGVERHLAAIRPDPEWFDAWEGVEGEMTEAAGVDDFLRAAIGERVADWLAEAGIDVRWKVKYASPRREAVELAKALQAALRHYSSREGHFPEAIADASGRPAEWLIEELERQTGEAPFRGSRPALRCALLGTPGLRFRDYSADTDGFTCAIVGEGFRLKHEMSASR